MPQFETIEGDFTDNYVKQEIIDILSSHQNSASRDKPKVDCVISDMAANFTGDQMTDALRTMNLCEDAMMFAGGSLKAGGTFICKFFACGKNNEEDLMTAAKKSFQYTTIVKPKSSRKESAELFLFATGYKLENK